MGWLRDFVDAGALRSYGSSRADLWRRATQVAKRCERQRVSETERRIVAGTTERVETLRLRSQGPGG